MVCLKHNAAVWLACWLPVVLASAVAATCAILVLRRMGAGLGIVWTGLAAAAAIGALAAMGIGLRKQKFFTRSDALVRLDAILGLHNRLTSAAAGVGGWPDPVLAAGDRWHWRWGQVVSQLVGASALVYAAAVVPLPGARADVAKPQTQPPGPKSKRGSTL